VEGVTDTGTCEGCGRAFERRRTETRRQFDERRFCSRACAVRRPRAGYRGKRERVAVACSTCGAEFETTPSRLERSRSGLLYCSVACQASDRTPGGPLHHPSDPELNRALLEDARTGLYTVAQLAERHGLTYGGVGITLHKAGVSLREVRKRQGGPEEPNAPARSP